jgi:hypothetical protein
VVLAFCVSGRILLLMAEIGNCNKWQFFIFIGNSGRGFYGWRYLHIVQDVEIKSPALLTKAGLFGS